MSRRFEPMKAFRENPDLSKLTYPLMVSPKLDGVRAIIKDGLGGYRLLSRKLKPIPNQILQQELSDAVLLGSDGELICGNPVNPDCFSQTQSAVMTRAGTAEDVTLHLFDWFDEPTAPYWKRYEKLMWLKKKSLHRIEVVIQTTVKNPDDVMEYEERMVALGYEGIMLRDPMAPYKYGRSTLTEQFLLKLKRFEDGEAKILEVNEMMSNTNPAEINELGRTKRSSAKAGMVGARTLGTMLVKDLQTGVEFNIGTGPGLTQALRKQLWLVRKQLVGRLVKYRFQPAGVKDKPRFPKFVGLRDPMDM